jgi:uncharacterized protein YbjT (DUF2867 family)
LGATGLVGGFCLDYLLSHPAYGKVRVLTRRPLRQTHPKLESVTVDFDRLPDHAHDFTANDLFCCLGTTRGKAGSKEAFYKVDFTYIDTAARLAAGQGVNQFMLISSLGADSESGFFYSRVKGEVEAAIQQYPFWAVRIFRPSVLVGERNENRWGEQLAGRFIRGIDFLTGGLLSRVRPVEAEVVARAMVNSAQYLDAGVRIYPSEALPGMARIDGLIV